MKRIYGIEIVFLILFTFMSLHQNVFAGYQELNSLKYDAQINIDGSMNVTETWNIDISETNTLFKNFKKDDSKYSGITDVKVRLVMEESEQTLKKINEWQYHVDEGFYYATENDKGNFEIGWGVGLDDSSANRTYEIEYKVLDVITKAQDYSELYWQFVGNENSMYINSVEGNIKLPATGLEKEMIKVWGHSGSLDGTIYSINNDSMNFNLNNVDEGSIVEIRVLFPSEVMSGDVKKVIDENILDKVIAEETAFVEEANRRREKEAYKNLSVVGIVCFVLGIFTIKGIKSSLKIINGGKKFTPTQKLEYFRDLPRENATPLEAYYLEGNNLYSGGISYEAFGKVFLATILQLNLKGYIKFENDNTKDKKEQITIEVMDKDVDELKKDDERLIYNFLYEMNEAEKVINSKALEKYIRRNANKVEELIKETNNILFENLESEKLLNKENQKIGMRKVRWICI